MFNSLLNMVIKQGAQPQEVQPKSDLVDKNHWTIKFFARLSALSALATTATLYKSRKCYEYIPYAVGSATVSLVAASAAYLMRRYGIGGALRAENQELGKTLEDLGQITDVIDEESDDLHVMIEKMKGWLKDRGEQADKLIQAFDLLEKKLSVIEQNLNQTFEASKEDMKQVIALLSSEDRLSKKSEELEQVEGVIEQYQALEQLIRMAMERLKTLIELAEASKQVDDEWDRNREELEASARQAERAAQLMQQVEQKLEALVESKRYIAIAKCLENKNPELFSSLAGEICQKPHR